MKFISLKDCRSFQYVYLSVSEQGRDEKWKINTNIIVGNSAHNSKLII